MALNLQTIPGAEIIADVCNNNFPLINAALSGLANTSDLSNWSDLTPIGVDGGMPTYNGSPWPGSSVDLSFIANVDIPAGTPVSVRSDGKVEPVSGTWPSYTPQTTETAYTVSPASALDNAGMSIAYSSVLNAAIYTYRRGNTHYYRTVRYVSGTTWTIGAETALPVAQFPVSSNINHNAIYLASTDSFLFIIGDTTVAASKVMIAATLSGDTLTFGTAVEWCVTGRGTYYNLGYVSDNLRETEVAGTYVWGYWIEASNYLGYYAVVFSVSGTVITIGIPVLVFTLSLTNNTYRLTHCRLCLTGTGIAVVFSTNPGYSSNSVRDPAYIKFGYDATTRVITATSTTSYSIISMSDTANIAADVETYCRFYDISTRYGCLILYTPRYSNKATGISTIPVLYTVYTYEALPFQLNTDGSVVFGESVTLFTSLWSNSNSTSNVQLDLLTGSAGEYDLLYSYFPYQNGTLQQYRRAIRFHQSGLKITSLGGVTEVFKDPVNSAPLQTQVVDSSGFIIQQTNENNNLRFLRWAPPNLPMSNIRSYIGVTKSSVTAGNLVSVATIGGTAPCTGLPIGSEVHVTSTGKVTTGSILNEGFAEQDSLGIPAIAAQNDRVTTSRKIGFVEQTNTLVVTN